MAMSLAAHGASRFNIRQNAEINVTPFVDVMLVLLIIFMVAIPAATVSVKVDLPPAQASNEPTLPPLFVSLALDGRVFVGDQRTDLGHLGDVVTAALGPNPSQQRINLRADKGVTYDALMQVMNALRARGFDKIGLVGEDL